jgi:hypothetical protein
MEPFGQWAQTPLELRREPLAHAVLDGFFPDSFASRLARSFPQPDAPYPWVRYWNPLEVKYALNSALPEEFMEAYGALTSRPFLAYLQHHLGDATLAADVALYGAGLHCMPRFGRLHKHLDATHTASGLVRAWNLVVYLSEEWQSEWGGATCLYSLPLATRPTVARVQCRFNRALLFDAAGWHGVPASLACPSGVYRNTLSCFYVTAQRGSASVPRRPKATFAPTTAFQEALLARLYAARAGRTLDVADVPSGWAPGNALDALLQTDAEGGAANVAVQLEI